jgi:hypothetical protein
MADLLAPIAHYFTAVGGAGTKMLLTAMAALAVSERTFRNRRLPWQWFYAIAFLLYLVAAPFSAWMDSQNTLLAERSVSAAANGAKQNLKDANESLSKQLDGERKRVRSYEELSILLKYLGPDVYEWHVIELHEGTSNEIEVGSCPSDHCLHVELVRARPVADTWAIQFKFKGNWEKFIDPDRRGITVHTEVEAKTGCYLQFPGLERGLRFVVIDAQFTSTKMAVGVLPGQPRLTQYYWHSCPQQQEEN